MKKVISILLTLCMLMALVPTAFAASTPPDFSDGWTALTSADGGKEFIGGNYYLNDDITIDYCLTFLGDVVLDLNGHVIKLNSELYGGSVDNCILRIFNKGVYNDNYYTTNFTLQDSNPTAKHYFSKQSDGTWKWDPTVTEATEGYELVEGGVITGGTGGEPISETPVGGGILIFAQSAPDGPKPINVTINGGNIVGCKTKLGGGIGNWHGTVTMNGGNIIGCVATQNGGGIENRGRTVTINGGNIKDCVANNRGGGIYNYSGSLNINGGNIIGCVTNTGDGGGIYVSDGIATVDGGNIKDCVAAKRGGGVYSASPGIFTLNSGKIENCSADEGGGVCESSTFTMNGGSIENCVATKSGGGVFNRDGKFKMKGGIIKNCTATKSPESNAYYANSSKLFADGGVIDGTVNISLQGTITRSDDAEGTTVFNEKVTYDDEIKAGIFYGGLEKGSGSGAIVGNTYTVKFFENDTDTEPFATALVVGDGTKLVPPTAPTKTGYTFDAWYTEGGDEYKFDSAVASDFSLYAEYTHTDHADSDGDGLCDVCDETMPTTPTEPTEPTEPTTPTVEKTLRDYIINVVYEALMALVRIIINAVKSYI